MAHHRSTPSPSACCSSAPSGQHLRPCPRWRIIRDDGQMDESAGEQNTWGSCRMRWNAKENVKKNVSKEEKMKKLKWNETDTPKTNILLFQIWSWPLTPYLNPPLVFPTYPFPIAFLLLFSHLFLFPFPSSQLFLFSIPLITSYCLSLPSFYFPAISFPLFITYSHLLDNPFTYIPRLSTLLMSSQSSLHIHIPTTLPFFLIYSPFLFSPLHTAIFSYSSLFFHFRLLI